MNIINKSIVILALVFAGACAQVHAGLISTSTNGGANFVPFGGTVTQYQSLYSGELFGGGLVEITSLDFFYARGGDGLVDGDFQISLSTSDYISMVTPAVTNVSYVEALSEGTNIFSQQADIAIVDGKISFNGSFVFDSSYNLIIDIVNLGADSGSDWERFKTAHNSDNYALGRRFTYLNNSGGSAESNSSSSEVAVQFGFNTVSVPEPSSLALFSLCCIFLARMRIKVK